jgi:hypothetical protein
MGTPPHRVSKFYYMVDSVDVVNASNEAFGGISMDVDGVTRQHRLGGLADHHAARQPPLSMDRVREALRCHTSQLPGFGPLAEWTVAELAAMFGMGYFYRAFSLVNGGRKVETDLFEGLRRDA